MLLLNPLVVLLCVLPVSLGLAASICSSCPQSQDSLKQACTAWLQQCAELPNNPDEAYADSGACQGLWALLLLSQTCCPAQACGCPAGQQPDAASAKCEACEPGRFKAAHGAGSCLPCPAGTYTDRPGATACQACTVADSCSVCNPKTGTCTQWPLAPQHNRTTGSQQGTTPHRARRTLQHFDERNKSALARLADQQRGLLGWGLLRRRRNSDFAHIKVPECQLHPIPDWTLCGGINCPGCLDAPRTGTCCSKAFTCTRLTPWDWRCLPTNTSGVHNDVVSARAQSNPRPVDPNGVGNALTVRPRPAPKPHREGKKPGPVHASVSVKARSAFGGTRVGLTTVGDRIVDAEGRPIQLKGVNWFGFNNGQTMLEGLWPQRGSGQDLSINKDFGTIVHRLKLLGFNAIRLPFSFPDLFSTARPKSFSYNCTFVSPVEVQASVTNPNWTVAEGMAAPPLDHPAPSTCVSKSTCFCNGYLPNDTTMNRFMWVVRFFARNGFYVNLDYHPSCQDCDLTVLQENGAVWIQGWAKLLYALTHNPEPALKGKLIVDLLNEPDGYDLLWEAAPGKPSLSELYLRAMDALWPINRGVLFVVEGTGQGRFRVNWGDGFVTDQVLLRQYDLSDPNPFFRQLISKPYANQVVLGPHIYGPSVSGAKDYWQGPDYYRRLSASFGRLTREGFCWGGVCKQFPVSIAEIGSTFQSDQDVVSYGCMEAYFNNVREGADGVHNAIDSWFFWAWNANSGDTGGIQTDNWEGINWYKVDFITSEPGRPGRGLGLRPWYLAGHDDGWTLRVDELMSHVSNPYNPPKPTRKPRAWVVKP